MSDNVNIGSIQAGVVIAGGSGHTVQSGNLAIRADVASSIIQLRELLNDLVRLSGQHGVSPQVQSSATAAAAEAAETAPDTGRLRALMDTVCAGVGRVGPVAQAALNVINVIGGIEKIIH